MKIWNIDTIEDWFEVLGRGLIIVIIPNKNGINFTDGRIPFSVNDICYYNSIEYNIKSIETLGKVFHRDTDYIGLNIK